MTAVLKTIPIDWPDREMIHRGKIGEYDAVLISQSTSINYPLAPKLSQSSFLAGGGAVFSEIPRCKKGKGNVNTGKWAPCNCLRPTSACTAL